MRRTQGGFTPGIFISYRREDAPGHAGRLYDVLSRRFGEEQVFMDLSMELGIDFVEHINKVPAGRARRTPTAGADSMTPRTSSASKSKLG